MLFFTACSLTKIATSEEAACVFATFAKCLGFKGESGVTVETRGALQQIHREMRRWQMRERFGGLRLGVREKRRGLVPRKSEALLQAGAPALPIRTAGNRLFQQGDGGQTQDVRRRDGIGRARWNGPLWALRCTRDDPFGARRQTDEARQADGAAIAREQTQGNLRKTNFRAA